MTLKWFTAMVMIGMLSLVVSVGAYAEADSVNASSVPASLDILNLRVEYKAENMGLVDALVSLSAAARVPICFENKVDRVKSPDKPAMPLVNVPNVTTFGEALASIMSQAPDYEMFWNRQLGYVHVVRKDLMKDPDWLINKVIDKIVKTDTLANFMELIRTDKLGIKTDEGQKLALAFMCSGQCPWQDAARKQQIALKVEKIVLRDLLDEIGRQLGLAGWTYGTTRNKDNSPVYGFLSFYPAADPLSLPPEYNAYYKRDSAAK